MISKEEIIGKGLKNLAIGMYFLGVITATNAFMNSSKEYSKFGNEYKTEINGPFSFYEFEINDDEISLTNYHAFRKNIEFIDKNKDGSVDVIVEKYGRKFFGESYKKISYDRLDNVNLFERADEVYNKQIKRFNLENELER
ncbi:MAG: hypothetical protein ACOC3Z_00915 [Nanoarchaeota archaeon]